MKKILQIPASFIAFLLAILFVLAVLLALLLADIRANLLNPGVLKSVLVDKGVYEKIPALAVDTFLSSPAQVKLEEAGITMPPFFSLAPRQALEMVLVSIIPPSMLKAQFEAFIDDFFSFLDGRTQQLSISLAPIKAGLSGSSFEATLQGQVDRLPDCLEELLNALASPDQPMEVNLFCKPPEFLSTLFISFLHQQMLPFIESIPDAVSLSVPAETGPGSAPRVIFGKDPLAQFRLIYRLAAWAPVLPAALMLAILLLAARTVKGGLRWVGIPVLLSGVLSLGAYFLLPALAGPAFTNSLDQVKTPFLLPQAAAILRELGLYFIDRLTGGLQIPSFVLLGSGLTAWILSFLFAGKRNKQNSLPVDQNATVLPG